MLKRGEEVKKNKMKKVAKHLKGDMKTWEKLSKDSKEEAESDKKLLKKIKKKKR